MSPTLGQRLRQAREKKGLSLADVAHQTRIPAPRLKDMEDDNFNALGGMTYARSFVQTYSGLLDVNADFVLEQMQPPPLGGKRDYRYLVENYGSWVSNWGDFSAPPAKSMTKKRSPAAVLAIASLVLLIGMGVLLGQAWLGDRKNSTASSARSKTPAGPSTEGVFTAQTPANNQSGSPIGTHETARPSSSPEIILPGKPVTDANQSRAAHAAPPKALPVEDVPAKSKP